MLQYSPVRFLEQWHDQSFLASVIMALFPYLYFPIRRNSLLFCKWFHGRQLKWFAWVLYPSKSQKGKGKAKEGEREMNIGTCPSFIAKRICHGCPTLQPADSAFKFKGILHCHYLANPQVGATQGRREKCQFKHLDKQNTGFGFTVWGPNTKALKTLTSCRTTFPTESKVKYFQAYKCLASRKQVGIY